MKATISYIEQKFQEFNHLCFEGKLPPIPIRLSNARNALGSFRCRRTRDLLGRVHYSDPCLSISTRYDIDETLLEDTLLHEMIHYYIMVNGLKDSSAHGPVFRSMMDEINTRYGRHISVSHRRTASEVASDHLRKPHVLCVARLSSGAMALVVCARSRVFDIYDELPRRYLIKESHWYWSKDPYFNRYPNSITAKLYRVEAAELAEHLKGAIELECDGRTMRPKRK